MSTCSLILLLNLLFAFIMFHFFYDYSFKILRSLQEDNTNESELDDYFIMQNPLFVNETYYNNSCNTKTEWENTLTLSSQKITKERLKFLYQINENLTDSFADYLGDPINTPYLVSQVIRILIPLILLVIASFIGWFTCCSCCCYGYCPIICKRKNIKAPYASTSKFVPVIVVLFAGFSLVVPSFLGYFNFQKLKNHMDLFYCYLLKTNFMIKE
jgi:hypothetical protein